MGNRSDEKGRGGGLEMDETEGKGKADVESREHIRQRTRGRALEATDSQERKERRKRADREGGREERGIGEANCRERGPASSHSTDQSTTQSLPFLFLPFLPPPPLPPPPPSAPASPPNRPFRLSRSAPSNTSLTPDRVLDEHSKYLAPMSRANASPSAVETGCVP